MNGQGVKPRRKSEKKTARQLIIEAMKQAGKRPITVSELVQMTKLKRNTVRGRLQELKREGVIERVEEGWVLKSEKN